MLFCRISRIKIVKKLAEIRGEYVLKEMNLMNPETSKHKGLRIDAKFQMYIKQLNMGTYFFSMFPPQIDAIFFLFKSYIYIHSWTPCYLTMKQ